MGHLIRTYADAIIVLPGGTGTLYELFETLELAVKSASANEKQMPVCSMRTNTELGTKPGCFEPKPIYLMNVLDSEGFGHFDSLIFHLSTIHNDSVKSFTKAEDLVNAIVDKTGETKADRIEDIEKRLAKKMKKNVGREVNCAGCA